MSRPKKVNNKVPSNPFAQPWFDWSTMDSKDVRKAIKLACMILRSNGVTESRISKFIKDMGFEPKDFSQIKKDVTDV